MTTRTPDVTVVSVTRLLLPSSPAPGLAWFWSVAPLVILVLGRPGGFSLGPNVVSFTLLGTGYFCVPMTVFELRFWAVAGYLGRV